MTAGEIRKMLKGIPKNMQVFISIGGDRRHICHTSSQPFMLEYQDTNEKEMVFILSECTCENGEAEKDEVELTGTYLNPN